MDGVAQLAAAGAHVDAMAAGLVAAEAALVGARQSYEQQYRSTLDLGWTGRELTEIGYSADYGGAKARGRGRRRADAASPKSGSTLQNGASPGDQSIDDSEAPEPTGTR